MGIVSSIAASVLTVTGGWIFSQSVRNKLTALLSLLTGAGILRVYRHQRRANADLPADLAKARWIKVLAGRGNELTRDNFESVWRTAGGRIESVQMLLPDPDSGADSWLGDREAELRRLDPGMRDGLLADQVRANIRYLTARGNGNEQIQLRVYDVPHLGRIILTDRVAYLTVYGPDAHGRNSPCIIARSPGPVYDLAYRMFITAWDRSVPAPSPEPQGGGTEETS
jgi:hypothetical protein